MLKQIESWHKAARPEPTERDFSVQLGCHLEELVEMVERLTILPVESSSAFDDVGLELYRAAGTLSKGLKSGRLKALIDNREALLDSLADQIVTAVGVGYCAGMQVPEACDRVNDSNWSKMVDGAFVRDANGKIAKPPTYAPPDLKGLY